jgi:hypothetical protein
MSDDDSDNRLKSLSHFDNLPNLQRLYLGNNRIPEIYEIERMKLPSLVEISMDNMVISKKLLYRTFVIVQFPNIRVIDGGEVTKEDKMKAEVS